MHISRGLLFWGLAFITAGAVALAVQQRVISREVVVDIWRFWPVILIAIGISIIAARTPLAPLGAIVGALLLGAFVGGLVAAGPALVASCGGAPAAGTPITAPAVSRDGTFGGGANVEINANCVALSMSAQDGKGWRMAAADDNVQVEADTARLSIRSPETSFFGPDTENRRWDVVLPKQSALDLSIEANAARGKLDLGEMQLTSLDLNANAGDVVLDLGGAAVDGLNLQVNAGKASVVLDDSTSLTGSMSANAGSLEVCAPASVGLQVHIEDNVAFGDNLDESGLRSIDSSTWRSASYDAAQSRVTLTVEGNAGSFTLNPDGGCQ